MTQRNSTDVALYTVLTLSIYLLFWLNDIRNEINEQAEDSTIPTMWWFIVPFGSFWWMWHFSRELERVSEQRIAYTDTFLLFLLLSLGGNLFFQFSSYFDSFSSFISVFVIEAVLSTTLLAIFPYVTQNRINALSGDSQT